MRTSLETHFYQLMLFKSNTCKDVPGLLMTISKVENLALGEVGKNLLYFDKKGRNIYLSFTPRPEYELDRTQRKDEIKKDIEAMLIHNGTILSDEIERIFENDGAYDQWEKFYLSSRNPTIIIEKEEKAEKQIEVFKKILSIFSKGSTNYIYNKEINLEKLLRQFSV